MPDRLPVLLLPGLLCDRELWASQIDALADIADARVADFTRGDDMDSFARNAIDLIDEPCVLMGLSMGGYVAFEVMRLASERVRALALIDTSARPDSEERRAGRRDMINLAGRASVFHGASKRLLEAMTSESRHGDQELLGRIREMTRRVGKEAFIAQQTAILGRPGVQDVLDRISVPTRVVVGRDDKLTPVEHAREIADGIKGAELTIIEDCGHLPTMERPGETSMVLREWLVGLAR